MITIIIIIDLLQQKGMPRVDFRQKKRTYEKLKCVHHAILNNDADKLYQVELIQVGHYSTECLIRTCTK